MLLLASLFASAVAQFNLLARVREAQLNNGGADTRGPNRVHTCVTQILPEGAMGDPMTVPANQMIGYTIKNDEAVAITYTVTLGDNEIAVVGASAMTPQTLTGMVQPGQEIVVNVMLLDCDDPANNADVTITLMSAMGTDTYVANHDTEFTTPQLLCVGTLTENADQMVPFTELATCPQNRFSALFQFTPVAAGTISISTCTTNTVADTQIEVVRLSGAGAPMMIACDNTNGCGDVFMMHETSMITLNANDVGQMLLVKVSSTSPNSPLLTVVSGNTVAAPLSQCPVVTVVGPPGVFGNDFPTANAAAAAIANGGSTQNNIQTFCNNLRINPGPNYGPQNLADFSVDQLQFGACAVPATTALRPFEGQPIGPRPRAGRIDDADEDGLVHTVTPIFSFDSADSGGSDAVIKLSLTPTRTRGTFCSSFTALVAITSYDPVTGVVTPRYLITKPGEQECVRINTTPRAAETVFLVVDSVVGSTGQFTFTFEEV